MKKVLLTLLTIVFALGLFAAVGFAGYRFGYMQGTQVTATGDSSLVRPSDNFNPRGMPMHNFGRDIERGFNRGFGPDGFRRMGFGFFSPILFLGRIVVLGLVLWFIYWLFTRTGWRITRTPPAMTTTPPNTEGGNQNAEANK